MAKSIGRGGTNISAFDEALHLQNLGNANLLRLSSVIPPGWRPDPALSIPAPRWGNRVYVVQARMEHAPILAGKQVGLAGGIGWAIFPSGGGVFVEHETFGYDDGDAERKVDEMITVSLAELAQRRGMEFVDSGRLLVSALTSKTHHTCVLASAYYAEEDWHRE